MTISKTLATFNTHKYLVRVTSASKRLESPFISSTLDIVSILLALHRWIIHLSFTSSSSCTCSILPSLSLSLSLSLSHSNILLKPIYSLTLSHTHSTLCLKVIQLLCHWQRVNWVKPLVLFTVTLAFVALCGCKKFVTHLPVVIWRRDPRERISVYKLQVTFLWSNKEDRREERRTPLPGTEESHTWWGETHLTKEQQQEQDIVS